jgi:hypothetical protein
MKTLTKAQQQKAKDYIVNAGRPLERALYQYYLKKGSAETAIHKKGHDNE